MALADKVKLAGVVGAGGGGFPTHVKLLAKADTIIANGAECEPLLHKDAVVMENFARELYEGVKLMMNATGASQGYIAIKNKNKHAIEAVEKLCKDHSIQVFILGDYYPAGDEFDLVYTITGRLIPPAGIPIQVGVVVNNVETIVNIKNASEDKPVIKKFITISGAVKKPVTLTVPIGTPFRKCIEYAGGLATDDPVLFVGGLMMGQVTENLDAPVTKTTTGVVVLPRSHIVSQRRLLPMPKMDKIGKSACDQCRYCTEYCPRYLLGYPVEPHQVMRSLAFTQTGEAYWNQFAALCCGCNLCTLFSCPEMLFPKEACDSAKEALRKSGFKWDKKIELKPHPMRDGRRVPVKTLAKRLHVLEYDLPAPWIGEIPDPDMVTLPLKQSAGVPVKPLVKVNDNVVKGQKIGEPPENALGAILHSSIDGKVVLVDDSKIVIEKS